MRSLSLHNRHFFFQYTTIQATDVFVKVWGVLYWNSLCPRVTLLPGHHYVAKLCYFVYSIINSME